MAVVLKIYFVTLEMKFLNIVTLFINLQTLLFIIRKKMLEKKKTSQKHNFDSMAKFGDPIKGFDLETLGSCM